MKKLINWMVKMLINWMVKMLIYWRVKMLIKCVKMVLIDFRVQGGRELKSVCPPSWY